jgi:hypothetical protein
MVLCLNLIGLGIEEHIPGSHVTLKNLVIAKDTTVQGLNQQSDTQQQQ